MLLEKVRALTCTLILPLLSPLHSLDDFGIVFFLHEVASKEAQELTVQQGHHDDSGTALDDLPETTSVRDEIGDAVSVDLDSLHRKHKVTRVVDGVVHRVIRLVPHGPHRLIRTRKVRNDLHSLDAVDILGVMVVVIVEVGLSKTKVNEQQREQVLLRLCNVLLHVEVVFEAVCVGHEFKVLLVGRQ